MLGGLRASAGKGRRAEGYSGAANTASPCRKWRQNTPKSGLKPVIEAMSGDIENLRPHQIIALWAYTSYLGALFGAMMRPMTSSEMDKLAGLYSELDFRLEQGEAESPELDRLFDEVSALLNKDADVWFHFDPAGMAQLVVHLVPEHRATDGWSSSDN